VEKMKEVGKMISPIPWKTEITDSGSVWIRDKNNNLIYVNTENAGYTVESVNNYEADKKRIKELEEALQNTTELIHSMLNSGKIAFKNESDWAMLDEAEQLLKEV
jgi:hypothetical protein